MYHDIKVPQVLFMRNGADTRDAAGRHRSARDPKGWQKQRCRWMLSREREAAYGSAINRSVSLMILFGSAPDILRSG